MSILIKDMFMNIDKYISWKLFLVSFCAGLIYTYCIGPHKKIVYIYPSPENINSILFRDNAHKCFKFHMIDTMCPSDMSSVKDIPIQI